MAESISVVRKFIDIFKTDEDVVVTKPSEQNHEQRVVKELENLKVEDIMEKRFIILSPSATIKDVAKIFIEKDMVEGIVVEGGRLFGVISYKDMLKSLEEVNLDANKIGDMEQYHKKIKSLGDFPISKLIKNKIYVFPHMPLFDAIIKMEESDLSILPVVDEGGYIVGILKENAIIQSFLDSLSKF